MKTIKWAVQKGAAHFCSLESNLYYCNASLTPLVPPLDASLTPLVHLQKLQQRIKLRRPANKRPFGNEITSSRLRDESAIPRVS